MNWLDSIENKGVADNAMSFLMFLLSNIFKISKAVEEVIIISQEELRELYNEYLEKGKQMYVAKVTGIDGSILSKFKTGKFDLYPHLFEKLEAYLLANQIKQPINQANISQESGS